MIAFAFVKAEFTFFFIRGLFPQLLIRFFAVSVVQPCYKQKHESGLTLRTTTAPVIKVFQTDPRLKIVDAVDKLGILLLL